MMFLGWKSAQKHLRQVSIEETVTAVAEAIHLGRSIQVWDLKICKAQTVVGVGRATLFVAEKKI